MRAVVNVCQELVRSLQHWNIYLGVKAEITLAATPFNHGKHVNIVLACAGSPPTRNVRNTKTDVVQRKAYTRVFLPGTHVQIKVHFRQRKQKRS